MRYARPDYDRFQDPAGKISADEPVFLIRGQDQVGADAVRAWAALNEANGGDPELTRRARVHAERMDAWPKKKAADLTSEQAAPTPLVIDTFRGVYFFLSNFAPTPVSVDGVRYPTVEHAYQAAKTFDAAEKELIRQASTPGEAKRLGRCVDVQPFCPATKLQVMDDLLRKKFAPGTREAHKLLSTGTATLVEGNDWGDTFWGVCNGQGENRLGQILMRIRADLHHRTGGHRE